MVKNRYFLLMCLLTVFLLVKVPIVLTSIYKIFDPREMYIGTVAKELIEGPALTLFDYQLRHPVGGSLVFGILAVPFFLLFGQSYFSLKLLALSYSAVTLIFWYIFLARFFNKRTALLASLFFIFSPPFFTKFSLMSYGKHGEISLFTIIVVLIFFRLFLAKEPIRGFSASSREESNKKLLYAAFGLLSGFGIYFDPIFFTTLATCFLFWFLFNKKFILKKNFLIFLIFFLVGFSPWIYYNASHNFQTVCLNDRYPDPARTLQELFPPNFFVAAFNNFKTLVVFHLPHSSCFENFRDIPGNVIGYAYYFVFILAFCALLWLNRKAVFRLISGSAFLKQPDPATQGAIQETFLLTYPVIHLLLLSVIAYAIDYNDHELYHFYGYRRLLPLYPFMFAIIAIFFDKLLNRKNKHASLPVISFLAVMFFILSGLIANCGLITPSNFGNHLIYEGYNYYEFGDLVGRRAGGNITKAIYLANKIKEPYRPELYEGIGIYWGEMFYGKQLLPQCIAELDAIDQKYRPYALNGLGLYVGAKCWMDMVRADREIGRMDEESRRHMYEGLGEWIGFIWGHRPDVCINLVNKITPQYQPQCYRGVGVRVGFKFGQNTAYCINLAKNIDPAYRGYYFEGLARNLGWRYKYYLKKDPGGLIARIPEEFRASFMNGLLSI